MLDATGLLLAARVRISKKENWVQHTLAQTKHRNRVLPTDPNACQWCVMGAVAAEAGNVVQNPNDALNRYVGMKPMWNTVPTGEFGKALNLLDKAAQCAFGHDYAWEVNDVRSHEDVLEILDIAIDMSMR